MRLIDQTLLPTEFRQIECRDVRALWEAIQSLRVRGAPAIGIAAAYGTVLGMQEFGSAQAAGSVAEQAAYFDKLGEVAAYLRSSRPTAVNLSWALARLQRAAEANRHLPPAAITQRLLDEARAIEAEDRETCRAIGRFGAELIRAGQSVLTHCNAGGLATADYGTALAVLFTAEEQGKRIQVVVDETRPLLQGARLTAWELKRRGIPTTLICDSMAAQVMKEGRVEIVIVGADRIAANGDTANKIGTYGVAVLARVHGVPFYVAAPSSTFDLSLASGAEIPIEQRDPREITHAFGRATAPEGIDAYNPAFDVTPAELITAIITERGVIQPVTADNIDAMLRRR